MTTVWCQVIASGTIMECDDVNGKKLSGCMEEWTCGTTTVGKCGKPQYTTDRSPVGDRSYCC